MPDQVVPLTTLLWGFQASGPQLFHTRPFERQRGRKSCVLYASEELEDVLSTTSQAERTNSVLVGDVYRGQALRSSRAEGGRGWWQGEWGVATEWAQGLNSAK